MQRSNIKLIRFTIVVVLGLPFLMLVISAVNVEYIFEVVVNTDDGGAIVAAVIESPMFVVCGCVAVIELPTTPTPLDLFNANSSINSSLCTFSRLIFLSTSRNCD